MLQGESSKRRGMEAGACNGAQREEQQDVKGEVGEARTEVAKMILGGEALRPGSLLFRHVSMRAGA